MRSEAKRSSALHLLATSSVAGSAAGSFHPAPGIERSSGAGAGAMLPSGANAPSSSAAAAAAAGPALAAESAQSSGTATGTLVMDYKTDFPELPIPAKNAPPAAAHEKSAWAKPLPLRSSIVTQVECCRRAEN